MNLQTVACGFSRSAEKRDSWRNIAITRIDRVVHLDDSVLLARPLPVPPVRQRLPIPGMRAVSACAYVGSIRF